MCSAARVLSCGFVYADFKTPAVETMEYLRAWDSLRRAYRKENPTVSEDALPEKVYDQTQEIEEDYYRYLDTLPLTKIMMKGNFP